MSLGKIFAIIVILAIAAIVVISLAGPSAGPSSGELIRGISNFAGIAFFVLVGVAIYRAATKNRSKDGK